MTAWHFGQVDGILYSPCRNRLRSRIRRQDAPVFQHSLRGPLARAHGQDDGGRAGDDIAAGEQAGQVGHSGAFVDVDVSPLVGAKARSGLRDDGDTSTSTNAPE